MKKLIKDQVFQIRFTEDSFLTAINLIEENFTTIKDFVNKDRRSLRKTRFGLVTAVVAGLAYVVHNEKEKEALKQDMIAMDKEFRGISHREDDGDALDHMV